MIGKVKITSTGYDPNGPPVNDPTLEPTKPHLWTAGELARVLAQFPPDTPVVGMGDDGSGYTLGVCAEMIVSTAEVLNAAKKPYDGLQWPADHVVIVPIEQSE